MSEWKKVKIGDFLTEREGRYKPDDKEISKHKRLEKIDFSGTIHISDKPTKTDMIIVHPGDLVISGINVAKGAVAVYQGNEPVCATIHYSSYTFDSSKVDLDYFKYFVKSPAFIAALQKQVKGGIKTEIKPRHLLPLEISIPDLQTQQEIVKKISSQLQKTEQLSFEIESQKNYIKQLRQNILQEAIEGKLTEDWRKKNPVQKGNPDYDAEALFEKILKEKCHTDSILLTQNHKKNLPQITSSENLFDIPKKWKKVLLGNLISISSGDNLTEKEKKEGTIPVFGGNGINGFHNLSNINKISIVIGRVGAQCGCIHITPKKAWVTDNAFVTSFDESFINLYWLYYLLNSLNLRSYARETAQPVLSGKRIYPLVIGLPSRNEQKEIVTKVESLLAKVTELDKQIAEREQLAKQLMQGILKGAFEEG